MMDKISKQPDTMGKYWLKITNKDTRSMTFMKILNKKKT